MGAGVIPIALKDGEVYFLFQKTFSGRKEGYLIDFGGGLSEGESYRATAIREFVEETETMYLGNDPDVATRSEQRVRSQIALVDGLFKRTLMNHPHWWCIRSSTKWKPRDWRTYFIQMPYRDVTDMNRFWNEDHSGRFKKRRELVWVSADELMNIYSKTPEKLWKRVRQLNHAEMIIREIKSTLSTKTLSKKNENTIQQRQDMPDINTLTTTLTGDIKMLNEALDLSLGGYNMRIRSNHQPLLERLSEYFSHVVSDVAEPHIEILAVERDVITDHGLNFIDWAREPGKTGRKDAYYDIPGVRVVQKVRTGMLFLQSETTRIAAGPCLQYDNQVINFINSQYMNWLQLNGWLICHASGLEIQGQGVGLAGLSGGGKSTLMLNLLENDEVNYLTNDRLFIYAENAMVHARGIPKLPRINPGTIVHNPRLHELISEQRRDELLKLPVEELWHLEEKYDVYIDRSYGDNRIATEAVLKSFVILNWQRDSEQQTQVTVVDIQQRQELLAALMKSPGPFYQHENGEFHRDDAVFNEKLYLDMLDGVTIYEVTGRIDFDVVGEQLSGLLNLQA